MVPEFEAVKRVKLGEEHRWTALVTGVEGFLWRQHLKIEGAEKRANVKEARKDSFMVTSSVCVQSFQKQPVRLFFH